VYRVDISEILLFLLSSEDGTGIFVAWGRDRFFPLAVVLGGSPAPKPGHAGREGTGSSRQPNERSSVLLFPQTR